MDESRESDHDQAFRLCSVRSVRCGVCEERVYINARLNLTTILCLCISCAHCTCLFDRLEEAHPLNLRLKPRVP